MNIVPGLCVLGLFGSFVWLLVSLRLLREAIQEGDVSFSIGFGACSLMGFCAIAWLSSMLGA